MSRENDRVWRIEHQLAVAQQITHIGSWEWDAATNAVTWSDELYRIYGYEPQSREISFEFFLSCLHPDDRVRVQREVGLALERGTRFAYPERIVRPDGSVRELDTVGEASHDASGRAVGLIGTCRDVTDDNRRDETIRLYADIVRNMQIGVAVCDVKDPEDLLTTLLVAHNPAAEKVARRSLAGSIGRPILEIFPYAEGGLLPQLIAAVARDGQVHEGVEERARNPKHPDRAIALKAFPLPGKLVGIAVEDITESTKVLRLQAAEHRMLERIAADEGLPSVLGTLALAIEEHLPPAMASVLLLDAEGRHIHSVTAPNVPADFTHAIEGLAIGPTAGSCGTAAYLRRPVFVEDIDKDPLWADYRDMARAHGLRACWSTPIFATDGRVLGTFALYFREPRAATEHERSILDRATHLAGLAIERRQLEDQLRELSAHVESVREDERTGIAREIHDELGQSLTALKMDLAWLARRISGESSVSEVTLLDKIATMSEMTDGVIDRVRRISSDLRPGVLDDLGLLAAVEWQAQVFEERSEVTCAVHSNLGDRQLDPGLSTGVFRIFQEALTNVTRHARATHVDVRLERQDGTLTLTVRDDGVGIAPEAARSPRSLGLLGMRERARRMGGAVSVLPAEGGGTLVELHVSVRGERAMIKVLVADDHVIVRRGLKQILSDTQDIVVGGEAGTAQEVMALVREQRWNVVLLDISLPGAAGLELLADVRREKPELPVLILTAYPEEQYAVRAIRAGAAGFLTKESAPEKLIEAVRKVASGGRWVSPELAETLASLLAGEAKGAPHERLSDREFEVFKMLSSGKTVSQVAQELSLSVKTVSTHRTRILKKMEMKTNAELTHYAMRNRLVE